MISIDIIKIVKSLEAERDWYNKNTDAKKLNEKVVLMQLNIFYSVYSLSFIEDNATPQTIKTLYRDYYETRFNGLRFLIELFLTSLEIMTREDDAAEYALVYALALSEKINNFLIDSRLLATSPEKEGPLKTLSSDINGYHAFINAYSKPSNKIPEEIEDFLPGHRADPRKNRKKEEASFKDEFGFTYFKVGKLNYGSIIQENKEIDNLFNYLHEEHIFNNHITKDILRDLYSIFSTETHPTISSIEDFEGFIGKNEGLKADYVKQRKEQRIVFLKAIGILMDTLYKNRRNISTTLSIYETDALTSTTGTFS